MYTQHTLTKDQKGFPAIMGLRRPLSLLKLVHAITCYLDVRSGRTSCYRAVVESYVGGRHVRELIASTSAYLADGAAHLSVEGNSVHHLAAAGSQKGVQDCRGLRSFAKDIPSRCVARHSAKDPKVVFEELSCFYQIPQLHETQGDWPRVTHAHQQLYRH